MESRNLVLKETAIIAAGELLCSVVMVGIFAALGYFRMNVLWSAIAGSIIITLNYFFMAVTVTLASERAVEGDAKQAQTMIQTSSILRLLVMGVLLFIGIRLGANVIALVLPLAFQRPILMLSKFFRKKDDAWTESK